MSFFVLQSLLSWSLLSLPFGQEFPLTFNLPIVQILKIYVLSICEQLIEKPK